MTGNRFKFSGHCEVYDTTDTYNTIGCATSLDAEIVYNLLNELSDENNHLKQFIDTVFVLINEMIETANHYRTPISKIDYGDDLGYWNGVYQKLKELRKILEKEKGVKRMTGKSELDKKLDFIVNLLFDVYCHCDVHYEELLAKKLAEAESVGFNIEPSKTWDYDKSSYEFWKKKLEK